MWHCGDFTVGVWVKTTDGTEVALDTYCGIHSERYNYTIKMSQLNPFI